jgi:sugar phosphate isomerase/epimerase
MDYGIQQLQLGSELKSEKKASCLLKILKDTGFSYIELDGFMIRKAPLLVRLLTSLSGMPIKRSGSLDWHKLVAGSGLKVIAIHEDLERLEKKPEEIFREAEEYSCSFIVLTGMYDYDYTSEKKVEELAERLNKAGQTLSKKGISLLYHNHNVEFSDCLRQTKAYDVLIDRLDPSFVNFEFDSYWATVAGADCFSYMERLGGRIALHHICDRGNLKTGPSLTPIIKEGPVELGSGNINLRKLLELDEKNGTKAVILEQHKNFSHGNLTDSIKISGKYLQNNLTDD